MGSFSIWHWLIVLLVVVLIFGTKKLRNIGQDLGGVVPLLGHRHPHVQGAGTDEEKITACTLSKAAASKMSICVEPL